MVQTLSRQVLKMAYPKRKSNCHKGNFGHLLVIGGSRIYSGSPAFAALAAYRSGVDIIMVAAPQRAADVVATFCPDMITYPLKGDHLAKRHLHELTVLEKGKDAIVIGGGLGKNQETLKTVELFLKKTKLPCVIDADAIYAVAKYNISGRGRFIITPHTKEFYALSGKRIMRMSIKERVKAVERVANSYKSTILLKGNPDIISDGSQTKINKTGNVYMTKGGTGDVLAGICGSLLAQGDNPFVSACAAAYINGRAGDIAAKTKKQSLMASDLLDAMNKVF